MTKVTNPRCYSSPYIIGRLYPRIKLYRKTLELQRGLTARGHLGRMACDLGLIKRHTKVKTLEKGN